MTESTERTSSAPVAQADTRGHMIAQDRLRPSPEGTGGGGNFGGLIPDPYKNLWNQIKRLRPGDFIPF